MMSPGVRRWLIGLCVAVPGGWFLLRGIRNDSPDQTPPRPVRAETVSAPGPKVSAASPAGGSAPSATLTPVPEASSASGVTASASGALTDAELNEWMRRAGADQAGTLAEALKLEDSAARQEVLEWILAAWTTEDRGPALEWWKKSLPHMTGENARQTASLLMGGWAVQEPLAAKAWAESNLSGGLQLTALREVAETWAQTDAEAMAGWVAGEKNPPDLWAGELVQAFVPTDPVRALGYCDTLADAALAESSRQTVIQSWLLTAPDDARNYLRAHPDLVPETMPEEYTPAANAPPVDPSFHQGEK